MAKKSLKGKIADARKDKRLAQAALKKQTDLHAPKGAKKAFNNLKDVLRDLVAKAEKRISILRERRQAHQSHLRQDVCAYAGWGVSNEPSIHYAQSRPIDGLTGSNQKTLPLYTDCSGFVTKAYKYAGAPDPNGFGYNGYGYTGTILTACQHISQGSAKRGDLVVFGSYPGTHVVVLTEDGSSSDPYVVSHGQEAGPLHTRLSTQKAAHPGQAVTFCRSIKE